MDSSPPHPIGAGQRLLAAIVFTDVVSFSARMQAEEVVTLGLLERDFGMMRALSEKYSGSVLKTTGDGLLLCFTSAVNAVAYAQKMQRTFAERARSEAAEQILTHRVGIHLGDVFVNNDDVMGDGVNIAARLQAQAEPGGICISQTVYDVVKNKLELEVVKLEPRELKNIAEPVPMYRIVLEAAKPRLPRPRSADSPLLKQTAPAATITRGPKLAIFGALLLGLALAVGWLVREYYRNQDDLARSRASQAELGALLQAKADDSAKSAGSPGTAAPANPPAATEPDFAGMLRNPPAPADDAAARRRADVLIPMVLDWVKSSLARYTEDRPLLVPPLPGSAAGETKVFTDAGHHLYFARGGAIRPRSWSDLKPDETGAIVVSVLQDSPVSPPAEVVTGAEAFAFVHALPGMADTLGSRAK